MNNHPEIPKQNLSLPQQMAVLIAINSCLEAGMPPKEICRDIAKTASDNSERERWEDLQSKMCEQETFATGLAKFQFFSPEVGRILMIVKKEVQAVNAAVDYLKAIFSANRI